MVPHAVRHATEIAAHYARLGLAPSDLRKRLDRHARMLSGLEPDVAVALGRVRVSSAAALAIESGMPKYEPRWKSVKQKRSHAWRRRNENQGGSQPQFRPTRLEWQPRFL